MAPKKNASKKTTASLRRVIISQDEFKNGITDLDNVQTGIEELQTNGFVIIENAIRDDIVEKMNTQMQADVATSLAFPDLVFNHGNERNNFSITPPLSDDLIFEDVWANRHAVAIMQQLIGPRPILCWVGSNVALQGSADARQNVHSDAYADILNFPYCIEMGIYLEDVTPENGSTEIWPGSHVFTEDAHLPSGRGYISKKAFTDRARTCPPIQPTFPAGSILLRDLRIWHSGMPNTTAIPRILVGLLYFPQWFRPLMRLTLPESVRHKAESWTHIDLITNTDFVEGPIDHLRTRFPMNFTQDPMKAMVPYRRAKDILQGRVPGAAIPVTKENYWIPSKYQTRAANKRKRQDHEGGEEAGSKQEQKNSEKGNVTKVESKQATETEVNPRIEAKPESEANLLPEDEHEEAVRIEIEVGKEPEVKQIIQESSQDMQVINDLPDYVDSPGWPDWIQRLQKDAEEAEKAAEDARISAAQKATFKFSSTPFAESGPGISLQFSPKSKLGLFHRPDIEIQKQVHKSVYKQPVAPVAKMIQSPNLQLPPLKPLTPAQGAWDRDPRAYKGPRPLITRGSSMGPPIESLAPPPSISPPIKHVSPYSATSAAATPSPGPLDLPKLHSNPFLAGPKARQELAMTPVTDAYDAYIQAQLDEKQECDLKRAKEFVTQNQDMREKAWELTNEDGEEKEWLSVEESQVKERGW